MFCRKYTVNVTRQSPNIIIRPLGDIHLSNLACDYDRLTKNIDYIKNTPNAYCIGMGDYLDNIGAYFNGVIDKRWNPENTNRQLITVEEEIEHFIELFKPISKKTMGLLAGNHEFKTINQKRFIKDICEPLGVDYLGRIAYVYLTIKYGTTTIRNYLILALHGGYSGMMAGGAVNRLKSIGSDFDADIILMGHNHDTWTRTGTRIGYDIKSNSPIEKKIIYANTGTFLQSYSKGIDGYNEINPREAKRVGTVTITLEPFSGGLHAHD